MATDGAAVVDGRAGITFGVELYVPWDAPEAVVDLQSAGVVDIVGLTGRRLGAAECQVLQGRDVCSVRVLVLDSRWLDQNFHDVTLVDMGDFLESSVSLQELSMLRQQWPPAILRHIVWLQQDLEVMHTEAKKRFHNARPGSFAYCGTWIRCDMYRHMWLGFTWTWHSCGSARCSGARCGRARLRIVWIMFEERMMFLGLFSRPASSSSFPRGQFGVRFGLFSRPASSSSFPRGQFGVRFGRTH